MKNFFLIALLTLFALTVRAANPSLSGNQIFTGSNGFSGVISVGLLGHYYFGGSSGGYFQFDNGSGTISSSGPFTTPGLLTATSASVSGNITAATFTGNGVGLTSLQAPLLTTFGDSIFNSTGSRFLTFGPRVGALFESAAGIRYWPNGSISGAADGTVFAGSGGQINFMNGAAFADTNGLVTVTNTGSSFAGTFTGNGAALTALNGTQVTSGTVADARLSANVSLLGQTISLSELANISTGVLLGRSTAGSGVPETLSIGGGLTLAGGVLSALGDATLVPTTITPTNFVLNTVYTNGSGVVQDLSVSAALAVAAVTGDASLDLMVDQAGGTAFALGKRIGIGTTIAVTLAGTYTNSLAHSISNLATYYFTNSSAGSGNSSSIVPGTGQIVSIGDGSVIGITNLQSGNTLTNFTVGANGNVAALTVIGNQTNSGNIQAATMNITGNATVGGTLGAITASSLSVTGAVPGTVKLTDSGGGIRAQLGTNDNLFLTNVTTAWTVAATNGGITVSSNIVAKAYYGDGSHLTGISGAVYPAIQRGVVANGSLAATTNPFGVGGAAGTENQLKTPVGTVGACIVTNLMFRLQLNAAMGTSTNCHLQFFTNGVVCTSLRCTFTGDGVTTDYPTTNDFTGSIVFASGTNNISMCISNTAVIPNARPAWSFQVIQL